MLRSECDHDADSVIHTQFQAQMRLHLAGLVGEAAVHTSEWGAARALTAGSEGAAVQATGPAAKILCSVGLLI